MAKNWSAAEAAQVVAKGTDKASIQDIGKRFPLFVSCAARGTEGLLEIIATLHPERITARTIESKLKEGLEDEVEEDEVEEKPAKKTSVKEEKAKPGKKGGKKKPEPVEEEDEDWDEEEEEEEEKPAKKASKGKPAKGKKKVEPEPEEEEEDDEDEDDDGLEDMSLAELKKEAKKRKVDIKGLKSPKEIIKALRASDEDEEDEDDDDDWDL